MEPKTAMRTTGQKPELRPISNAAGLTAGCILLTLDGELPIEFVNIGDRIITRDSGIETVRAIITRNIRTDAVSIMAGSLGHTRPERNVTLPAGQEILIRDWRAEAMFGTKQAMIPAARLVDGEFVTLRQNVEMTIYEVVFDAPHVIYADGLEVASHAEAEALASAA